MLGSRNSPFASHWFIRTDPVVSNEEMISRIKRGEIQLVDGCNVYSRQEDIVQVNSFRKRKEQEVEVKNECSQEKEVEVEQHQHQEEGQRKRRRKKKRVKKEDKIQAADGSNPFF
jgi:formyltetrahydrofolate synthetase